MAKKYVKVAVSDELKESARRLLRLFAMLPSSAGQVVITGETLPAFTAAFEEAGLTFDDLDRLDDVLFRLSDHPLKDEKPETVAIAVRVDALLRTKYRGRHDERGVRDAAYQDIGFSIGKDKSTVGRAYRKLEKHFRNYPAKS